jgi:hypothetical protein
MADRANVFGDSDFDVSGFEPTKPSPAAAPEAVRKVAERAEFSSREPDRKRPKREPRTYRTGRNAQFSCKADPDVVDDIYAIAKEQGWVIGLTLERAVAALKKEIADPGRAGRSSNF